MPTLNLADLATSQVKYKISKFPDGQQQVLVENIYTADGYPYYELSANVFPTEIHTRLTSFRDLELLICTIASLRTLGVKIIDVYISYFLGARSDRQFQEGENNYLRDVICPIIRSLNVRNICVLDPHSNCLEMGLPNMVKRDNVPLVKFAVNSIYPKEASYGFGSGATPKYPFILVSPDAGASHKIYKVAQAIGFTGDILTCSKERDEKGNLTNTIVPIKDNGQSKDYIIIDDICDGGRTFINIAIAIKNYYNHEDFDGYQPKIYLIVTHGIFSNGYMELNKWFNGIYTTNSFKNIGDFEHNGDKPILTNVKQLKVI